MTSDYHQQANQIVHRLTEGANRGTALDALNKEVNKLRRARRYKAAQSLAEQSLRLARGSLELDVLDDPYAQGVAFLHLAAIFHAQGQLDEAANKYQESIRFFLGDKHSKAVALFGLATVCEAQGKWLEAHEAYLHSVTLLQDVDCRLRRTVELRYWKTMRNQRLAMDSGDTGEVSPRHGRAGPVQTEASDQEAKQEEGEEDMSEQLGQQPAMDSRDTGEESPRPGGGGPAQTEPSGQERSGATKQSPLLPAIQGGRLLRSASNVINLALSSYVLILVGALAAFGVTVLVMLLASIVFSVRGSLGIVFLTAMGTTLASAIIVAVLVGSRVLTYTVPPDRIAVIRDSRGPRVLEEGQSTFRLPLHNPIQAVIPTMELRCHCPRQKVQLADGALQLAPVVYYRVDVDNAVHAPHFFREPGENDHKKTKKKQLTEADMKAIWDKEITQEMAVLLSDALCVYRREDVHNPSSKATVCQQLLEGLGRRSDQWGITVTRVLLPPIPSAFSFHVSQNSPRSPARQP